MSDSIFLIGDDGAVTEARGAAYSLEAELQNLLADNIDLLPGAQAVILDEAHQVPDIAAQFFGEASRRMPA